ncbi:MAG: polysaccharide deacetylase family protein [Candidatus Limnocylindrales bacterium]
MAPLDRRQFLKRGLLVLGALTSAGAVADLLAGQRPVTTMRRTPGLERPPLSAATTPTPVPTVAPIEAPAALPSAPSMAEAARWPVPTPGIQPPAGFGLRVPVLMYHRVVEPTHAGDSLPGLVVPPPLFAAQLELLHAVGWRTCTAARLAEALQHGHPLPPRTFVITLDDGWSDGATQALPILQRFGYSATYYVIGGRIGRPGFLGAADLEALVAAGMEIGDHTLDHLALPRLDPVRQRYEIAAASARIAQVVGQAPVTFSYPSGRFSPAVEDALAQLGFGLAVTTTPGTGAAWSERFVVPRQRVTPSMSPTSLLAQLELGHLGL